MSQIREFPTNRTVALRLRCIATILVAAFCHSGSALAGPAVGEAAPDFALSGSDGSHYTLGGLLADRDRGVVLAWFPKAFTPG